ncbi:MAG: hypothetical protein ABWK53_09785 [Anaerolineales bacterium]
MIDILKILKRSWHILWNYKVLWIFGFLLVVTGGMGGSGNGRLTYQGQETNGRPPLSAPRFEDRFPWLAEANQWIEQHIDPLFVTEERAFQTLIWLALAGMALVLILAIPLMLIYYPSSTAVIRMVDDYEQTGARVGFRQGWKLGWNRAAFRLWVIDLIVHLPVLVFIASILGLGFWIFRLVEGSQRAVAVAGVVAAVGCTFLLIFLFTIVMVVLRLLREFFWRAAVLENLDVRASFRRGWEIFKRHWQSGALMWLAMLGIRIGYAILGIIATFLLIPVMILTGLAGAIVAAIPAFLVGGLISLFAPTWVAVLVGLLVAAPFFLLILASPLLLIDGWVTIYESSVWTLTFREMKALEELAPQTELPAPAE